MTCNLMITATIRFNFSTTADASKATKVYKSDASTESKSAKHSASMPFGKSSKEWVDVTTRSRIERVLSSTVLTRSHSYPYTEAMPRLTKGRCPFIRVKHSRVRVPRQWVSAARRWASPQRQRACLIILMVTRRVSLDEEISLGRGSRDCLIVVDCITHVLERRRKTFMNGH